MTAPVNHYGKGIRLCWTCRRLSPEGAYCPYCGCSFRGCLCPVGHLSPPRSRFCGICRRTPLSTYTPSLPLRWLSHGLSMAFVIGVTGWTIQHRNFVLSSTAQVTLWILIHLLHITLASVECTFRRMSVWLLFLLIISWLLPGAVGKGLWLLLWRILHQSIKIASHIMRRLLEGPAEKKKFL